MDNRHQIPPLLSGLEHQLQGGPVGPVVDRVDAGEAKVHKAAAGVGVRQVFQSVAAGDNPVDSDVGGLGVVVVIDIALEILKHGHLDGVAPAVLEAPGVRILVLGQVFDLVGVKGEVAVRLHGGVGGEGDAQLRVDIGGQRGPVALLDRPVDGAGGAKQGEVVLGVQEGGVCGVRRRGAVPRLRDAGGRGEILGRAADGEVLLPQGDGQQNPYQQAKEQAQDAGKN